MMEAFWSAAESFSIPPFKMATDSTTAKPLFIFPKKSCIHVAEKNVF